MRVRDIYKWSRSDDAGGDAAPDRDSRELVSAPGASDDRQSPSRRIDSADLEIEKKKFRLAGIDPEKFDYFFDKYYDRIFEYTYWQSGDHDIAADVTSETFLRAWDNRRRFRFQGYSFGAWLFQIARNVLSHQRRRETTRRETEFVPGRHDPVIEAVGTAEIERRRDQELIRRSLQELKPDPFEVVVLHHFVGMTTQQIAVVTKRPEGTVKSHLRRARKILGRWLKEQGKEKGLSDRALAIVRGTLAEESGFSVVSDSSMDSNKD